MQQGLPSSDRYCDSIPPPLRRGRVSRHFQRIGDTCCLHPFASGSAFLVYRLTTQQCSLYVTDCYLATPFPEFLHTASALELPPILGICYMAFWCYHDRTFTCKHLSAWLGTPQSVRQGAFERKALDKRPVTTPTPSAPLRQQTTHCGCARRRNQNMIEIT